MNEVDRIKSIKQYGGCHLRTFKKENITYEMCKVAVQEDGDAIEYVPKEYLTQEIYSIASETNGRILYFIPKEFITEKLCRCAVINYGQILEVVPQQFVNEEICKLAVINNPIAFKYIPMNILTADFVAAVVKDAGIECIKYLPNEFKETKFYLQLVSLVPSIIWQIPKNKRNSKLCKLAIEKLGFSNLVEAVKVNPKIITLVPPSMYSHEAALIYVQSNDFERDFKYMWADEHYKSLSRMLQWDDVCKIAIEKLGWRILEIISENILTEEMCLEAVKRDRQGCALEYVPVKFRSKTVCEEAFKSDPYNIKSIPKEFVTSEMCLIAVKYSGFILKHIPDSLITRELCEIAVMDEGKGNKSVPKDMIDKSLALLMIENSNLGFVLEEIPENIRDYDVCYAAVSKNAFEISNVPEGLRTKEICLMVAKQTAHLTSHFPADAFSHDVYVALASHGIFGLRQVPKEMIDEEVCLAAVRVKANPGVPTKWEIPEAIINQRICNEAMVNNPCTFIEIIPERFVTEEMLLRVAEQCPGRLTTNFPQKLKTDEFIKRLVATNPATYVYIRK